MFDTAKYDITIQQGTSWQLDLELQQENTLPIDLTNYTGRMQIRKTHNSSTILVTVTITFTDRENGKLSLSLSENQTKALDFFIGYYDLELIDGSSKISRILEGSVFLSKEVTR